MKAEYEKNHGRRMEMNRICKYHLAEQALAGEEAGKRAIELERARTFFDRCSDDDPCEYRVAQMDTDIDLSENY